MVARGQGASAEKSVPKIKPNAKKTRTPDTPNVEHPAATKSGVKSCPCEECHAK